MPSRATAAGLRAGDVAAVEDDLPGGRLEELGEQVEDGGLAGAVGADQRMDGAAPHLEVDAAHGREARNSLVSPEVARM